MNSQHTPTHTTLLLDSRSWLAKGRKWGGSLEKALIKFDHLVSKSAMNSSYHLSEVISKELKQRQFQEVC